MKYVDSTGGIGTAVQRIDNNNIMRYIKCIVCIAFWKRLRINIKRTNVGCM